MIYTLRRTLIVLLALLQLVAPLLHAHPGANNSPDGIHLPGLEIINTDNNASYNSTAHGLSTTEGIIIGISSGIKHSDKLLDSFSKMYFYMQVTCCINEFIATKINFSPHTFAIRPPLFSRFKPPRAPPAILFS